MIYECRAWCITRAVFRTNAQWITRQELLWYWYSRNSWRGIPFVPKRNGARWLGVEWSTTEYHRFCCWIVVRIGRAIPPGTFYFREPLCFTPSCLGTSTFDCRLSCLTLGISNPVEWLWGGKPILLESSRKEREKFAFALDPYGTGKA